MGLFVLYGLLVVAGLLPDLMPDVMGLAHHGPDLFLLVTLYMALRGRGYSAIPWAILVGLVCDSLSLDPMGTHAFVHGTVAFFFCEGRHHRGRVEGVSRALMAGTGVVVGTWIYLARLLPMGNHGVEFFDFVGAFVTAFWSMLFALGLYGLLDRYRLLDDVIGRSRALSA